MSTPPPTSGPLFERLTTQNLQRSLGHVADELTSAVDADGCFIYSLSPDQYFIPILAGGPLREADRALFFANTLHPETDVLAYRILGRPVPVISNRVAQDPRVAASILTTLKAETALAVPVHVDQQVAGLVLAIRRARFEPFTAQQVHLAESICAAIALALENAQLYHDTQNRLNESQSLHQVTLALLQKLELEEVLQIVCNEAQRMTRAEGCCIALLESDEYLRIMYCTGNSGEQIGRVSVAQSLIGLAVRRDEPVLINNRPPAPTDQTGGPISMLALPLRVQGRTIGVLDVVNKLNGFSADDVRLIQLFADEAAMAVEHARLARQVQEMAVVEERHRLSRELHDSVNQLLYGISLYTKAAARQMDSGDPNAVRSHLEKIGESAQEALNEMRMLIFELRPSVLGQMGLQAALNQRLKSVEDRLGLASSFKWRVSAPLDLTTEEGLYGIAQEALNNVVKHSRAHNVSVHLVQSGQTLIMKIEDDGVGFEPAENPGGGMGLRTMQERAEALKGRLEIRSQPGSGTVVSVEMKL